MKSINLTENQKVEKVLKAMALWLFKLNEQMAKKKKRRKECT